MPSILAASSLFPFTVIRVILISSLSTSSMVIPAINPGLPASCRCAGICVGDFFYVQDGLCAYDDHALYAIPQFAHVARPGILVQNLSRIGG